MTDVFTSTYCVSIYFFANVDFFSNESLLFDVCRFFVNINASYFFRIKIDSIGSYSCSRVRSRTFDNYFFFFYRNRDLSRICRYFLPIATSPVFSRCLLTIRRSSYNLILSASLRSDLARISSSTSETAVGVDPGTS